MSLEGMVDPKAFAFFKKKRSVFIKISRFTQKYNLSYRIGSRKLELPRTEGLDYRALYTSARFAHPDRSKALSWLFYRS